VNKSTPQITWPAPAAITYDTALSATQLNATSTVAGTFVYSPAAGAVLSVGTHTLSVAFTPADSADYTTASSTVVVTVNKGTPQITWPAPPAITYGTALGATQLNATSDVAGTFAYSPAGGTVLAGGTHVLTVTFTPNDTTDYVTTSSTVTLLVNQATPTITWPTPTAVNYGTALSSAQLNATASVPGTFVYSPVLGTVLPVGSDKLSVTFTPNDTTDYTAATASVTLVVNPFNPIAGLSSLSPAIASAGGPAFTLTVTGLAFQSNSTVYWGTTALSTNYVSDTQLTAQVPAANIATAGTASITVQTPAPGGGTSNALVFEIDTASGSTPPSFNPSSVTITAGLNASYPVALPSSATGVTATCLNLPAGATCSYSSATGALSINTSPTTPKGTYQITVVFSETLPGAASTAALLPFLLLPIFFLRKRLFRNGWIVAGIVIALAVSVLSVTGCGGGGSSSTPPQTHQVTSSANVTLTIQ